MISCCTQVTQSIVFFAISSLFSLITSLPFNYYRTFVIEQKHGFNKSTLGLFFIDLLKSVALGAVIGVPVLSLFLHIVKWGGDNFFFYVWLFFFVFQLIMGLCLLIN